MNVIVSIAGQEIEVAVTPEQEAELRKQCEADIEKQYEIQFMANFFRETSSEIRREADFTADETDLLVDELFHAYPNPQELCVAIRTDNYLKQIQELVDGIVDERAKFYRVTVYYEGEFDVLVKARNEDEAVEFIEDADHYDLADYVDAADADFGARYIKEADIFKEWEVDFDATDN